MSNIYKILRNENCKFLTLMEILPKNGYTLVLLKIYFLIYFYFFDIIKVPIEKSLSTGTDEAVEFKMFRAIFDNDGKI